ncbi:hypothetical protein M2451_000266 [Dysgonomonas sp. PFB1-18]|nr:hypothetical protein [Dysgonomonas sp. PF1-14]MDH6337735.1 hypothetical protein [Dysgonomonas sp. PF1-16]MDH6378959.1 hypothetical protein [Dysgonomonas sp. PFB1-18]MDH6396594.1 hypothetical protein [Dysgonomonas sp. PF1-23]
MNNLYEICGVNNKYNIFVHKKSLINRWEI